MGNSLIKSYGMFMQLYEDTHIIKLFDIKQFQADQIVECFISDFGCTYRMKLRSFYKNQSLLSWKQLSNVHNELHEQQQFNLLLEGKKRRKKNKNLLIFKWTNQQNSDYFAPVNTKNRSVWKCVHCFTVWVKYFIHSKIIKVSRNVFTFSIS